MTQPIDPQQAQRVWTRVLRAQPPASVPQPPRAAPEHPAPQPPDQPPASAPAANAAPPDAAALVPLLQASRAAVCQIQRLAGCLRGRARRTLLLLAARERCAAQTLAALCYLTTGQRPTSACASSGAPCGVLEALRRQYDHAQSAAEHCRALAAALPAHADALTRLSAHYRASARQLLCLLQTLL